MRHGHQNLTLTLLNLLKNPFHCFGEKIEGLELNLRLYDKFVLIHE
jgi:hypothetical protein